MLYINRLYLYTNIIIEDKSYQDNYSWTKMRSYI